MEYFVKQFRDLAAFSDYLSAATTQPYFLGMEDSLKTNWMTSWYGSESYQQADEWLKSGDDENAKQLVAATTGVRLAAKHGTRYKDIPSVVGYRPNVPAWLKGLPNSMYRRNKLPVRNKVINIIYNNSADASVDTQEKVIAGCLMAHVILAIERKGYRVNLWASSFATCSGQACSPLVRVKSAEQSINLYKLAYSVVNSSFQRRHGFRFRETMPGLSSNWVGGYGSSVTSRHELEKILKGAGIKFDVALTYYDVSYCSRPDDVLNRYFPTIQ